MAQQLSIVFPDAPCMPRARRVDPITSHLAAASSNDLAAHHHKLILKVLRDSGPLGKDGIGARTALTGVQVCRRLGELERLGLIEPTGRNVQSTAGRSEREWRAA